MNKVDINRKHNELWQSIETWYSETHINKWKCISAVKESCIEHMGETAIFQDCFMCEYFRNGKLNNRNKEGRGCRECPLGRVGLDAPVCPPYRDLHLKIQYTMHIWWKIRDHGKEFPNMKVEWERALRYSKIEVIKQIEYIRTRRIK